MKLKLFLGPPAKSHTNGVRAFWDGIQNMRVRASKGEGPNFCDQSGGNAPLSPTI